LLATLGVRGPSEAWAGGSGLPFALCAVPSQESH
jgi:hypothetical protein